MPRTRRQKLNNGGGIYHVMSRSISELDLFKSEDDKKKYMLILEETKKLYSFKVYSYCLMDNHVHLIIDANGSDISKIMQRINFKYASYYNKLHNRHGHLFQDRFKSKIIDNNRYLITLSLYIHNNPLDIQAYKNNPENYFFSSLSVYLGLRKDPFNILDEYFILSLFGENMKKCKERYMKLSFKTKSLILKDINKEDIEFENEKTEYKSYIQSLRNFDVEAVIKYISALFNIESSMLYVKYHKTVIAAKSVLIVMLRNLCNLSCKDICAILGNITSSTVSKLSSIGLDLISKDTRFSNVISDFMCKNKVEIS